MSNRPHADRATVEEMLLSLTTRFGDRATFTLEVEMVDGTPDFNLNAEYTADGAWSEVHKALHEYHRRYCNVGFSMSG